MTGSNLELVQVYSEGIKAWFPDEELGWVSASVIAKEVDAKSIKISFQDDEDAEKVDYTKRSVGSYLIMYADPSCCV